MHPLMIVNGTKDPIRAGLSPATLRAKFPFREPVVTAIWLFGICSRANAEINFRNGGSAEGSGEHTRPRVWCSASRRTRVFRRDAGTCTRGRVRSPASRRASPFPSNSIVPLVLQLQPSRCTGAGLQMSTVLSAKLVHLMLISCLYRKQMKSFSQDSVPWAL
jgi:hypothetical protein